MKLFSVCPACDFDPKPFDGSRTFGDLDQYPKCNATMNIWTESGIRNEKVRLGWGPSLTSTEREEGK